MVVHKMAQLKADNGDLRVNIWSKLPDELIYKVLEWLPLAVFFRMRCVCKEWNNTMFSQNFLAVYSRVPSGRVLFLHVRRVGPDVALMVHDAASSNSWQPVLLDCVPIGAPLRDSAGGLLLYERKVKAFRVISVCNPLTKKWRDLPPMRNPNISIFVKLIRNQANNNYKIVRVARMLPDDPITEVYDSKTDSWTLIEHTPTDFGIIQGCSVFNISVGLQCWTGIGDGCMIAFEMARSRWTEIVSHNLDGDVWDSTVVDCNGRPYLVTLVRKDGKLEKIDIRVQNPRNPLDGALAVDPFSDVNWEKIDSMPPALLQQWNPRLKCLCYHVGVGDHIYSTCLTPDDSKLITYNVLSCKWQLIDGCPPSDYGTFMNGFEFRPSLDAAV